MIVLRAIALIIQFTLIFYSAYIFFIAFAGVFRKKRGGDGPATTPPRRFAILIPAHNEEQLIPGLLTSLQTLDYPQECYDVYVVADNCTDNTAEVAQRFGAITYERFDETKMAKGHALEILFDRIRETGRPYDGYVLFDADNIVDPFFLREIDRAFSAGRHAVQGMRRGKNTGENWVARLDHIAETSAFVEQRGRDALGLSCTLNGSAMAFSSDLITQLGGWRTYSILEDMEMQVLCVLKGFRIGWWPEAVAFGDRSSSMLKVSHQRLRWLRGEVQVVQRYFLDLLMTGIRKADLHRLEHCLWMSRQLLPRSLLFLAAPVIMVLSLTEPFGEVFLPWQVWLLVMAGYVLYFLVGLATQKADWRTYIALVFSPAFMVMWLWVMVRNVLTRKVGW